MASSWTRLTSRRRPAAPTSLFFPGIALSLRLRFQAISTAGRLIQHGAASAVFTLAPIVQPAVGVPTRTIWTCIVIH